MALIDEPHRHHDTLHGQTPYRMRGHQIRNEHTKSANMEFLVL